MFIEDFRSCARVRQTEVYNASASCKAGLLQGPALSPAAPPATLLLGSQAFAFVNSRWPRAGPKSGRRYKDGREEQQGCRALSLADRPGATVGAEQIACWSPPARESSEQWSGSTACSAKTATDCLLNGSGLGASATRLNQDCCDSARRLADLRLPLSRKQQALLLGGYGVNTGRLRRSPITGRQIYAGPRSEAR